MQRRRFKNILSFPDRLDQEIERLRAEAEKLPPDNREREMILRKARQAETPCPSTIGCHRPDFKRQVRPLPWPNIAPTSSATTDTSLTSRRLFPNDAEAIEKATRLVNGRDVELWSGARFVTKLEADPK